MGFASTKLEIEIDKVNALKSKDKIFKALTQLKETTKAEKKKLLAEKSYNSTLFFYIVNLQEILKVLPEKISDIPQCSELHSQLMTNFKEEWNNMPSPTHHLWPAISKVCQK